MSEFFSNPIVMGIAAALIGGLWIWLIVDKIREVIKWNKIRKTCKHKDWIYFRRCKTCGRLEVLDPKSNEYRKPDFKEEANSEGYM